MDSTRQIDKAPRETEVVMVDPEIIQQIRGLDRLGWGSKRISNELGLSRNTVRRYLRLASDLVGQRRPLGRRLDDEGRREAVRLLAEEAEGNAVVVHRLLTARGMQVGLRTVQRVVSEARTTARLAALATVRFETAPGHQLQIDFGEKVVRVADGRIRVYVFVAVLGYSRRIFVCPFLSQRQDDWCEGIAAAFAHFGGVPQTLLIDNPKAMVLAHAKDGEVKLHPTFDAFCKDWGVAVRACKPYRARTKGKTESGVKYVKRNALAGLSFTSFAALQNHLATWMEMADGRCHGTTGEAPAERFAAAEAAALKPLPARIVPTRQRRLQRKVANDSLVNVDNVRYSVPHRWIGSKVDVQVGIHEVCIYVGLDLIARHRRTTEPYARVVEQSHYDGLLRRPDDAQAEVADTAQSGPQAMGRSMSIYADVIAGGGCD